VSAITMDCLRQSLFTDPKRGTVVLRAKVEGNGLPQESTPDYPQARLKVLFLRTVIGSDAR
jgi:hypothetical protein